MARLSYSIHPAEALNKLTAYVIIFFFINCDIIGEVFKTRQCKHAEFQKNYNEVFQLLDLFLAK